MPKLKTAPSLLTSAAPTLRAAPKVADSFYQSPEWRRLLKQIKSERGPHCERCGSNYRVIGDHIREIRDGGARLDPSNIELLCIRCHNTKTAAARRKRDAAAI